MKRNISDLLDQYPVEDMELGETTPYSSKRIKEITMNQINIEANKTVRRFHPMRLLIAAAVAIALSVSALAAGYMLGAGELFRDFFTKEGNSLSQGQMDTIDQMGQVLEETDIDLSAAVTDNGATITPLAAIADENAYYLRLQVDAPAGTALPDLDESQGCYQLKFSLKSPVDTYKNFSYDAGMTVLPDDDPADNRKEFVLFFHAPMGGTDLQFNDGFSKELSISGLWVQSPDKEYTAIFTGDFIFDIGLNFQSQTIDLDCAGVIYHNEVYGYTNILDSLKLSPLSITAEFRSTLEASLWLSPGVGPLRIVLKDGTIFWPPETEVQISGRHPRFDEANVKDEYVTSDVVSSPFDQPLDLSQVDYVQYGDSRIPVNAE